MTKELPRGVRNNNPGNIEYNPKVRWQGLDEENPSDGRFCRFKAPEWGIRAIARTLITYQDARTAADGSKIDTIREAVSRWAPANENDVDAYTAHVCDVTNKGPHDTIDVHQYADAFGTVKGIISHECSNYEYPKSVMDKGLTLAGIEAPKPAFLKDPKVLAPTIAGAAATAQQAVYYTNDLWGVVKGWGVDPLHFLIGLGVVGAIAAAFIFYQARR